MRRLPAFLFFLLSGTILWACGDKLVLVMGARPSQIRGLHPAAILAFPGRSPSAELIRSLPNEPSFRKAGLRFQLADSEAAFENALKNGKYDVVLADLADAGELNSQLSAIRSRPVLLPVAFKSSKEEQAAAVKKYHCLLKAPSKTDNYLDAIDRAMELKLKAGSR